MKKLIGGLCSLMLLVSMTALLAADNETLPSKPATSPAQSAQSAPPALPTQSAAKAKPTQAAPKAKPAQAAPKAKPTQDAPPAKPAQPGFPVLFSGTEILNVSTSLTGELTPENRAKLIQQNIQTFADSKDDTTGLKVIKLPEGAGIGNDASILLVITKRDAEPSGKPPAELANEILTNIQTALITYRTKKDWKTYGLGATYSFLSIILLWLVLHLNKLGFVWLTRKTTALHKHWKGGISLKGIEVLSAHKIERAVLMVLKFLRIFVILLCLYFLLPLILSFFPETREMGSKLLDYLITPFATFFHTIVKYIPNFFYILVIIVIAKYVLKLISYVFMLIARGELKFDWFYEDWALPTYQIVRFLIIVTALISAYPYIPGSSSQAFQGVGLVLGAIISFASSSAISNIVAGIILTYTRAFRLSDRIKVGETTGDVAEKTLLVTRVKTIKNVVVTIPNSLVMGAQIINYSTSADAGEGVIMHTTITIGYDVPWKKVQSLLIESAIATEHILKKPKPFVLQTSLDDFYVSYEINAYTKEPELMAAIYSELHQHILTNFNDAGIEIMSPHYYSVRDGNATTVPSLLTAKNYTAPAFHVQGAGDATGSKA